ncbi:hypothetical protein CRYUN_Cryun09bG0097400 [Craigia yunnanensis]
MDNAKIQNHKPILGLQQGKKYSNVKSLRYGHLMIMTDQDHDGSYIKGLLINFIHSFWSSLLKVPSFMVEFVTPIVKVSMYFRLAKFLLAGHHKKSFLYLCLVSAQATHKDKIVLYFYSMPEYESWKESLGGNAKDWSIKFYKGLGTSISMEGNDYFKDLDKHKKQFVWEGD